MARIGIDLGHGVGSDRGAVGFIQEEEIINSVGNRVIAKLKTLGHTVILTRPSSVTSLGNSLAQRVNISNANNVDLFISIHSNAGGGRGTEVFTYNGNRFSQAVNVLNNIVNLGFVNRGIKPSNNVAYVVNHTNAKAMLIEICFVDTQSDVDHYKQVGPERIADAIVKGLVGTTTTTINSNVEQHDNRKYSTHLRDWQSAYNKAYNDNILVDGIRGSQVENAMRKAILKFGTRNGLVSWLQCRIGAGVDGVLGSETKSKVIEFQKNNGLETDGIVGYNTWNALINKYSW